MCSYPGDYRIYTKEDAQTDFPFVGSRPGSDGVDHRSGLIFLKGGKGRGDRASVGEGNLRVMHPEGKPNLSSFKRIPSIQH